MQKITICKLDQIEVKLLILTNQTNYFMKEKTVKLLMKKHWENKKYLQWY